jgi:hypothetical protein
MEQLRIDINDIEWNDDIIGGIERNDILTAVNAWNTVSLKDKINEIKKLVVYLFYRYPFINPFLFTRYLMSQFFIINQ